MAEHTEGFLDALRDVSAALDATGTPAAIIGGVAAVALGVKRFTADIDFTILAAELPVESLLGHLRDHGIVERLIDAVDFAKRSHVLLVKHLATGINVDAVLAWLPFEEEALRESIASEFGGVRVRVLRPEDLIIQKVVASRPRDLTDVEDLLALYGGAIDLHRVRRIVAEFCDLLDDRKRLATLDDLVARTPRGK